MEGRSGKSSAKDDQLRTCSGAAGAVTVYLACCCHCCCIWPELLGFVGGGGVAEHPHPLLFFSLEKAAMSPVITGGVFEVSGMHCVYIQSFQIHQLRSCLLSQAFLCAAGARCWLVSLRSGALPPALFVCLFTCLLWSASSSVCLLVSPCSCSFIVPVLMWRSQTSPHILHY